MKRAIIVVLIILIAIFSVLFLNNFFHGVYQTTEYGYKVKLTAQESTLEKQLATNYKCDVSFTHSGPAIAKNRTNGTFYVILESKKKDFLESYCLKDSLFLDSLSKSIAKKVYSAISHKNNYDKIHIFYRESRDSEYCNKLIEIPTKDLID
ncbi:hypothetical protein [Pedobacter cryoconitis]|uniref:Uncharacterized protein n=1 Tax=Pedobacter cryoconitis TaxID=188932 RepID=A0A327TB61_9SPHI|nr:hypothetical protein [Pedobacter cryoconitis]RAJ37344.1 hypothetical protein LY11_00420 [Pedobacter cryoconitis]